MMSGRVPAGTHSPYQSKMWRPGRPASSMVGTSGSAGTRSGAVTAKALILPSRMNGREFCT
jgi:hypothetical protein